MTAFGQLFHPGAWLIWLVVLFAALPLYVFLLWKSLKFGLSCLAGLWCFGVYLAFFSARNFGGAFGAGLALACLSALLVPISLIFWLLLRHASWRRFADDPARQRWYALGGVFILLIQLLPITGSYAIDAGCFAATRRNAAPLIAALQTYWQQNGAFPADPQVLIPRYLPELPVPACGWLSGSEYRAQLGFEVQQCPDGTFLLTNLSMDGSGFERYNFTSGNWSSVSFLDGACNFLP